MVGCPPICQTAVSVLDAVMNSHNTQAALAHAQHARIQLRHRQIQPSSSAVCAAAVPAAAAAVGAFNSFTAARRLIKNAVQTTNTRANAAAAVAAAASVSCATCCCCHDVGEGAGGAVTRRSTHGLIPQVQVKQGLPQCCTAHSTQHRAANLQCSEWWCAVGVEGGLVQLDWV